MLALRRSHAARVFPAALVATVALSGAALAQSVLTESPFTLAVPAGWQVRSFQGLKYKVAVGTPAAGFAPNITIVDEAYAGPVGTYADASEKQLATIEGYKKLARAPFTTAKGVSGVRLLINTVQQKQKLRQLVYLLPGKKSMFVVTGSVLAAQGDKQDKLFDAAAKSFTLK